MKYKPLIRELVVRDLKVKYRRSFLGYLWSLLNPLLMMAVMLLVFNNIFRFDILNYPLYLICGQTLFNFFNESTTMAMYSVLGNAALPKTNLERFSADGWHSTAMQIWTRPWRAPCVWRMSYWRNASEYHHYCGSAQGLPDAG